MNFQNQYSIDNYQYSILTIQYSITPNIRYEAIAVKSYFISVSCRNCDTLNYPILGTIVLKYPDMIAKESKNIKIPVTMSKTPVTIDMSLICRFSLWK